MEAEEEGMNNHEKLSGFIFMCNSATKPDCYRYRVFGLPAGRKDVVEKINPGTYLFLFDTDVKLLYGPYIATSTGKLKLEPLAFGRKFPAQVRFKVYVDCLPLPENCFKHAIRDNYQKNNNKFNPELNIRQVRSLLELFRPLHVSSTAPTHPVLKKIYSPSEMPLPPVNNVFHQISRPSISEDAYLSRMLPDQTPRKLNYRHVNELEEPTGCAYPVINLMPNSAAAQSLPSQASRNQLHASASTLTLEGTYAAGMGTSYTRPLLDYQYTHQNILNRQPEFHSSLLNKGSGYAQSLQDPQYAHHNILHPQPGFHSSMITTGSSHAQSLQDPLHQHQSILHPPPGFHSSVITMGSSHAESLQDTQHQSIIHPQPELHSSTITMDNSHARSLQDPQHPHQSVLNPPRDFHSSVANVGGSYAQYDTHQNILNMQSDSYSSMANIGSSYAQLPDPQHTHQETQNLQPYFNSYSMNMGHADVTMQSHASSSLYYPYVPQQVVSATYSGQGSGAIQGLISSDQQTGTGSYLGAVHSVQFAPRFYGFRLAKVA
ncbi:uncharacterized protein LOC133301510 isoform X2 [Gastrolobium bilobum]|uniref:uncharacterized protein LOC133301510 isoform X2 n=1 Tax=Gastrolobium bilobum TaxID=150636 RepID=UPI002AB2FD53|nr:uncharacterized protein LOC133301510 isoform X2 [Gastrolobium bilobum]